MKTFTTIFGYIFLTASALFAQLVIENFDSYSNPDHYRVLSGTEDNAIQPGPTSDVVYEGRGALRLDWTLTAKSFAGLWTRLELWQPDSGSVWDCAPYLYLSLWYYNIQPSTEAGKVTFTLFLFDVSHASTDSLESKNVERWYSNHKILDLAPGWNQITIPLHTDEFDPASRYWLQDLAGFTGNRKLDFNKIKGFGFQFSGSASLTSTATKSASGALALDQLMLIGDAQTARAQAVTIVVLGSSTAEGTGPQNRNNAWVNRYRAHLKNVNLFHQVINLAKGGYTTYHIMPDNYLAPGNRPQPDPQRNISKALTFEPDAIVINMPSNDVTSGYAIFEQLDNYERILKETGIKSIPVWISTTQPRNLIEAKRKQQIEMRDSTFSRYGTFAIDFWTDIAQENGMINPIYDSGDGIHLNDEGHRVLAERVIAKQIPEFVKTDVKTGHLVPKSFRWSSNYPNPFNSTTTIEYLLTQPARVEIQIFNSLGQRIEYLPPRSTPAGTHRFIFNAAGLSTGLYIYNLSINGVPNFGKMLYVK